MNQKYFLTPSKNKTFSIVETLTKYVMLQSKDKQALIKLMKKLNRGSGFNGESPGFFVGYKTQK